MSTTLLEAMDKELSLEEELFGDAGLPLTINVDMDGVVYDVMSEYLRMFAPHVRYEEVTSWSVWEHTGQSKAEFWQAFHSGVRMGLFLKGEEYTGASSAIRQLTKAGHRVRIVTSKTLSGTEQTRLARVDTLGWLSDRGLGRLEVVFTGGYAKQGYPADVIIDDKPTLEWVQPGRLNILFDQPWNQELSGDVYVPSDLIRAQTWAHVVRQVERVSREGL